MKKRLWALLLLLVLLVPPGCRGAEREDFYFVSLPRAFIDWDYEYREARYSPVVYHYTGGGELTPVLRLEEAIHLCAVEEDRLWYATVLHDTEEEAYYCVDLQKGEERELGRFRLNPWLLFPTDKGLFLHGSTFDEEGERDERGLFSLSESGPRFLAETLEAIYVGGSLIYTEDYTVFQLDPESGESRAVCTLDRADFPYLPPRLLGWEDGVLSVSAYRCILRISAETGEELGRLDTTGKGVRVMHDGWYYATRRPEGQEEERCLELLRLNAAGEEQVYGTLPVSGAWNPEERFVFGRRGFLYFADPDIEHYADGADGYWYFPYEGGEPRRVYAGSSKLKTQN